MLKLNHKFEISLLKDIPRYLFLIILLFYPNSDYSNDIAIKSSVFLTLPTIKRIILQIGICILPIYKIFIYEPLI